MVGVGEVYRVNCTNKSKSLRKEKSLLICSQLAAQHEWCNWGMKGGRQIK